MRLAAIVALVIVLKAVPVSADAVLFLGESYGRFGSVSPTGHAALYLTGVCAETPVLLRRCAAGEHGAVISRYHRVGEVDWIAIPIIPYLYAVETAASVPVTADRSAVLSMRDAYRRRHLMPLVPDRDDGTAPTGNWVQLVGSAYDRTVLGFSMKTTPSQDDVVIALLNGRPNVARFNILTRNCADFVRDVMRLYDPRLMSNNWIADLGVTTPKQLARSLVRYAGTRPELDLKAFSVPQIGGSRRKSRPARGVLEALVKTKKYAIPMTLVQPWVSAGVAAGYLINGRFNPHRYINESLAAADFAACGRCADVSPNPVMVAALGEPEPPPAAGEQDH